MSTLVEELEQAAERADERARTDDYLVQCVGGRPIAPRHRAEAARLRARAERVMAFEAELARADKLPLRPGVLEVFQRLTGPLDTP